LEIGASLDIGAWNLELKPVNEVGKVLVVVGLVVAVLGGLLWAGFGNWLGKLPGDVNYSRGNFSVHFPIVTCVIISVVLTLLLWLFRR
jgi:uncharacterized protein HemY